MLLILVLESQGQVDSWGPLPNLPTTLLVVFQASERSSLKKQGGLHLKNERQSCLLASMCMYTRVCATECMHMKMDS